MAPPRAPQKAEGLPAPTDRDQHVAHTGEGIVFSWLPGKETRETRETSVPWVPQL